MSGHLSAQQFRKQVLHGHSRVPELGRDIEIASLSWNKSRRVGKAGSWLILAAFILFSALNLDLVGDSANSLMLGEPRTVYVDHPADAVWLIALVNRFAIGDPIVAARAMNIVAAIGAAVAILVFVYRRTSPLPAVGVTVARRQKHNSHRTLLQAGAVVGCGWHAQAVAPVGGLMGAAIGRKCG